MLLPPCEDFKPAPTALKRLLVGVHDHHAVLAVHDNHIIGLDAPADIPQAHHRRDSHGTGENHGVRRRPPDVEHDAANFLGIQMNDFRGEQIRRNENHLTVDQCKGKALTVEKLIGDAPGNIQYVHGAFGQILITGGFEGIHHRFHVFREDPFHIGQGSCETPANVFVHLRIVEHEKLGIEKLMPPGMPGIHILLDPPNLSGGSFHRSPVAPPFTFNLGLGDAPAGHGSGIGIVGECMIDRDSPGSRYASILPHLPLIPL